MKELDTNEFLEYKELYNLEWYRLKGELPR
jgi:hypothetical protein